MKTIDLHETDACPACNGSFVKCPQPTAEMRTAAASRDDGTYRPIPPNYDTAPQSVVDELGELWKCDGCGMPLRVIPADTSAADAAPAPKGKK